MSIRSGTRRKEGRKVRFDDSIALKDSFVMRAREGGCLR